jgi:hypothetical protein
LINTIEIYKLELHRVFSQKLKISLAKQGKFKVGVVPADGLGRLLLKLFVVFIDWGSLAMSAGAYPVNFWPI